MEYHLVKFENTPEEYPERDHPYPKESTVYSLKSGETYRLLSTRPELGSGSLWLRFTIAKDVEEDISLSIRHPSLPQKEIIWEIKKPHYWQLFEVDLRHLTEAYRDRPELELSLVSPEVSELMIYGDAPNICHRPHLLEEDRTHGTWTDLTRKLLSPCTLQPFGWLEGCVLDGIAVAGVAPEKRQAAIEAHWDFFLDEAGNLSYLDPFGNRMKNELYSIESTLPFANPSQRLENFDFIVDFWEKNRHETGLVMDLNQNPVGQPSHLKGISAEGCYTIAYPMARMAETSGNPDLFADAQNQLALRFTQLFVDGKIHQKKYFGRNLYYPNWARALGWFLIGYSQTLDLIPESMRRKDCIEQLATLAGIALDHQLLNGLWSVFTDRKLEIDTSGSATILSGLSTSIRLGVLPREHLEQVEKGLETLETYISADGFLRGSSQLNRGGEQLQESSYRVLSAFATGLASRALGEYKLAKSKIAKVPVFQ